MKVPVYEKSITPQLPTVRVSTDVPRPVSVQNTPVLDYEGQAKSAAAAARAHNIGGALVGLGATLYRVQDDQDRIKARAAANDFKEWVTNDLNNEQTGRLRIQGSNVMGLADRSRREYSDQIKTRRGKLQNSRQRDYFDQLTDGTVRSAMRQIMDYEYRGTETLKNDELKRSFNNSLGDVARQWNNDAAVNQARNECRDAVVQRFASYGTDVLMRKLKDADEAVYSARLTAMNEQDPRIARQFFEKVKPVLSGDTVAKFEKTISNGEKIYWIQDQAEKITDRFCSEREAVAYVRKNYSGQDEDRLASAVKTRFAEREYKEAQSQRSILNAQNATYEGLYKDYWSQGKTLPPGLEDDLYSKGQLSMAQHMKAREWRRHFQQRTTIEKSIDQLPDAGSLTPDERETRVRQYAGITDRDRNEVIEELNNAMYDGTLSDESLDKLYVSGYISKDELQLYKINISTIDKVQGGFVKETLNSTVNTLKNLGLDDDSINSFKTSVNEQIMSMNKSDPEFRKNAQRIIYDGGANVVANSGKRLNGYLWGTTQAGDVINTLRSTDYTGNPYGNFVPRTIQTGGTGTSSTPANQTPTVPNNLDSILFSHSSSRQGDKDGR